MVIAVIWPGWHPLVHGDKQTSCAWNPGGFLNAPCRTRNMPSPPSEGFPAVGTERPPLPPPPNSKSGLGLPSASSNVSYVIGISRHTISAVLSDFLNLNNITWPLAPAMHSRLDSGQIYTNCTANGSSSLPSSDFVRGLSKIFAVFNLYRICSVPALASQNFKVPSWWPVMMISE